MNEFNRANTAARSSDQAYVDEGLRSHMLRIYNYMTAALSLTGIVAWFAASTGLYQALATSALIYVVMFAPLGVVLYFASKINTMSASRAQSVFWVFAGLMGLSLSYIFLAYTGAAVFQAFFVTAGAFAGLSIWGYTTKRDLSAMGAFLIMGLIGLIIASVVNLFVGSGQMSFIISVLGVLIFAGLTAWDTQKLKRDWLHRVQHSGQEVAEKSAIMGALTLYLDFINLFLFILQFMGRRD
ncbi:MAG: Bax inhibitor-1/YccA family protein [Pseudomonadota bacterium]|nr:Bax inhibitor-1/YccA family protein [Pseudomonadota bacterium]